ncbi:MAG: phosphomannose isomerase type II C-terminal cupin domain [bacterium]|nr:phosphomannose isomerase type II C-terminal cupin domain [bacterium]
MQSPIPFRDERPWGEELWLIRDYGAPSMVKIITVNPGESLSLQFHNDRDEFWHVLNGEGTAEIGTEKIPLVAGGNHFIPRTTHHRLSTNTSSLTVLELTFGTFDEKDIVRLEDKYGRT